MLVCSKKFFSEYMFGHGLEKLTPREKQDVRIASIALGVFTLGIVHAVCAVLFLRKTVKTIPSSNSLPQNFKTQNTPSKVENAKRGVKRERNENFQELAVQKPEKVSKINKPEKNPEIRFKKDDYDYEGYSEEDIKKLHFAENCCAFPKLALHMANKSKLTVRDACIQINKAGEKIDPKNRIPNTLSAEEVLKYN